MSWQQIVFNLLVLLLYIGIVMNKDSRQLTGNKILYIIGGVVVILIIGYWLYTQVPVPNCEIRFIL